MLARYSHIRMEAKRKALEGIVSKPAPAPQAPSRATEDHASNAPLNQFIRPVDVHDDTICLSIRSDIKLIDIFRPGSTDHAAELFSPGATKAIDALVAERNGKTYVRCQVRATDVLAKPEEVIRQFWLYRLIHHYKYPVARLGVEYLCRAPH
jgi:hypothetical protein